MEHKLIQIISEEIAGFDFLKNEEQTNDSADYNILKDYGFQKDFICDSLTNSNNINIIDIAVASISGDYNDGVDGFGKINIDYYLNLNYQYSPNDNPINFGIHFEGYDVSMSTKHETEPEMANTPQYSNAWFDSFNWLDINVTLHSSDGHEIEFKALGSAPDQIKKLFIREYVRDIVTKKTDMDIYNDVSDNDLKSNNYC